MKTSSPKDGKPTKQAASNGANRMLLGQILVELGYITIYQLDEALQIQRNDTDAGIEQKPLGQVLLELGYCSPNHLIRAIQVQTEYRKAGQTG